MLRFKTINKELKGIGTRLESSYIGFSKIIVSLVIDVIKEETSSLIGNTLRRSREIVI